MEQAEDGILKHYAALQPPPRDPEGGGVPHHDVADNHQCSSHVPTGLPVERTQTNTLCQTQTKTPRWRRRPGEVQTEEQRSAVLFGLMGFQHGSSRTQVQSAGGQRDG